MARKGKPCGAAHISSAKVCRVGLATEVNHAINAATGEIGAASLKAAVQKYAGGKGVDRLREIRADIRQEMGGNIVKGPRADELKRRLQEEGLLPPKGKSVRQEFTPLPTDIKQQLAALAGPTNRGLQKEYDKLDAEQKALEKEIASLKAKVSPKNEVDDLARYRIDQAKPGEMLDMRPKPRPAPGAEDAPYRLVEDAKQQRIRREKFRNFEKEDLEYYLEVEKQKAKPNQKNIAEYQQELKERVAAGPKSIVKEKDFRARRSAGWTDDDIEKDITAQYGDTNYNWEKSRGSGSKVLGAGAYGSVMKEGDGNAVKRGNIGYNEAQIIDKVGNADLGPRMLAADLDGMGLQPGTAKGRIAMTVVPGSPIGNKAGDKPIGRTGKVVADAYWEARAKLHKMGIAHNDMHIENVFVDRKGTGRFVDMGLAQDSPKAALAEAMGVFQIVPTGTVRNKGRNGGRTGEGDWQAVRWEGSAGKEFRDAERSAAPAARQGFAKQYNVAGRVLQNKGKAILKMKSYGLNDQDVSDIMTHGIRSTPESFERGAMGKLTNQQAQNVINTLYEGI